MVPGLVASLWTAYERVRSAILEELKSVNDFLTDDAVFSTSYSI